MTNSLCNLNINIQCNYSNISDKLKILIKKLAKPLKYSLFKYNGKKVKNKKALYWGINNDI